MLAEKSDDILKFVRGQFPTLASEWVFMDNAGGSVPLARVIERTARYMTECPVQLGASYEVSALAQQRLDTAMDALATFTNAREPAEIISGPSTSSLISRLSRAMASRLVEGDEIIVTNVDHEANISPWLRLQSQGITVNTWKLNLESMRLELDDLADLMTERTRLVCFTHASNVLGNIEPVAEITRFVHEHGADVCVDGVAYAPHHEIDVQAWDVDYYVFSLYKVYGPHQAVMVGKRNKLEALENINHCFFKPDDVPAKFQPGGMNYEESYASGAVPEYYSELGALAGAAAGAGDRERIVAAAGWMSRHEEDIVTPLLEFLDAREGVRIIGSPSPFSSVRTPTVSFVLEKHDSASIPPLTDRHKIAIRWGHFYAPRLIEYLGLAGQNGVVRASLVHYNSRDEVMQLIRVLDEIL
ncbi:MAG: aminotransferase class V-fold PLP-dependent enzyme [Gammaproteobacteria bacterium]|nr:aminotransferase class V-fold PLP-dependent enzyme [Gammaproteobacteria bacterium]